MKPTRFAFWIAGGIALLSPLPLRLTAYAEPAAAKSDSLRLQIKDPSPAVRKQAALRLAERKDAAAIPVLIDLLAELSAAERESVEELLKELAGEWAPILQFAREDEISRGIRRDAWASWWRRSDGPMLLAALGKHTLTTEKRRQIRERLAQLGSEEYKIREDASEQLLAFGRLALPSLRETVTARDPETARRAKMLIERIETGPDLRLPIAVLRLLSVRKPAGAAEALLAYLPFAEDEIREDEVRKSLIVLARRDGKLDPALRRSLVDMQTKVRSIAAEALIEGGGNEGRTAVRKMLREDVPSIRMRLALAMVRAGQREGISALIDLLPVLSEDECGRAEEALYQLAGETAPEMPAAAETSGPKQRRDAWAAWWKVHAARADLSRLTVRPLLGYTLICQGNRVLEIDRQGKTRWSIDNLAFPTDAWLLPGNRVLITEWNACCVTERDRKGNVLWKKDGLRSSPVYAQRLPNGNTFIAIRDGMMLEVDRTGKEIYKIDKDPDTMYAYRSRQESIVCLTRKGQCLFLDTNGKPLRSFALKYPVTSRGGLDLPPDGRILVASEQAGKVMEYDKQGKLLREWDVPRVTTATGLPNGHILASSPNGNRVVELDRAGKVVWEKAFAEAYRARRR